MTRDDLIAEFTKQVNDTIPENRELTDEDKSDIGAIDLDDIMCADEDEDDEDAGDVEP